MPNRCVVLGCRHKKGHSLFQFPKDTELNRKWRENSGIEFLNKNSRLCEEHFTEDCFVLSRNRAEILGCEPPRRFQLEKMAVPTIFMSSNLRESESCGKRALVTKKPNDHQNGVGGVKPMIQESQQSNHDVSFARSANRRCGERDELLKKNEVKYRSQAMLSKQVSDMTSRIETLTQSLSTKSTECEQLIKKLSETEEKLAISSETSSKYKQQIEDYLEHLQMELPQPIFTQKNTFTVKDFGQTSGQPALSHLKPGQTKLLGVTPEKEYSRELQVVEPDGHSYIEVDATYPSLKFSPVTSLTRIEHLTTHEDDLDNTFNTDSGSNDEAFLAESLASQKGVKDIKSFKLSSTAQKDSIEEVKEGKTVPLVKPGSPNSSEEFEKFEINEVIGRKRKKEENGNEKQGKKTEEENGNLDNLINTEIGNKIVTRNTQFTKGRCYKVSDVVLDHVDFNSLEPTEWLTDHVLNAILGAFMSINNKENRNKICVSQCYLEDGCHSEYKVEKCCDYEWLFTPINVRRSHWVLLAADVTKGEISVLDSISEDVNTKIIEQWIKFYSCPENVEGEVRKWKIGYRKSAQQNDNSSCGLFVIMNAIILTKGGHPQDLRMNPEQIRRDIYETLIGLAEE